MKRKSIKTVIATFIVMCVSCGEPDTIVTNIIHPDGSITRKLEIRGGDGDYSAGDIQVPLDSTWTVRDSVEIDNDGDTIKVRRAEKYFASTDEINKDYSNDSSANSLTVRKTEFIKRFRWFNTVYRFSEVIDKSLEHGYPVSDFLNEEELDWFYLPESIAMDKLAGTDSLKYHAISDTVVTKKDRWLYKSLVSEWIYRFQKLAYGKTGLDETVETFKENEELIAELIIQDEEKFDSIWQNNILLKDLIGEEKTLRFRTDADSAFKIVTDNFIIDFVPYTIRIVMPGEIIGTNGFIDSANIPFWPVSSDYFLTEPYIMYSESKITNTWAWIFSGIFLLFVLTGIIFRVIKK